MRRILVIAGVLVIFVGACSDDKDSEVAEPPATEQQTSTPVQPSPPPPTTTPPPATAAPVATPQPPPSPSASPTTESASIFDPDPTITGPAVAVCLAYGELDEVDGVGDLVALMTPDVVVVDVVAGTEHRGREAVALYLEMLRDTFGIESADCRDVVQAGDWVGGAYVLYGPDGPLSQGMSAIHVVDGKVDQQINHYTPISGNAVPPIDAGAGAFSTGYGYCNRWVGGDPDEILAMMSAEPAIHTVRDFNGGNAVRGFIEALPYEILGCSLPVINGEWDAVANTFALPGSVDQREMLSVIAFDSNELVREHWFYFDAPE